jgi:hypothetical protein
MFKLFAYLGAVLAALVVASAAAAQPIFTEVREWYIHTSFGPVGYRETEGMMGERYYYLYFGPLGGLAITRGKMALAAAVLAGLAALVCAIYFARIQRRQKRSHDHPSIDSVDSLQRGIRESTE